MEKVKLWKIDYSLDNLPVEVKTEIYEFAIKDELTNGSYIEFDGNVGLEDSPNVTKYVQDRMDPMFSSTVQIIYWW